MGTSAFDPVVLADVRSVRHSIDVAGLTGDILAVGDVIRYDPVTDLYYKAKADNEENSLFVGVVETISGTSIDLVYSGEISLPNDLFGGYTEAQVFYLSSTNAGKFTPIAPSSPGSVIKPVIIVKGNLTAVGEVDGIVVNPVSQRIGGDSEVDTSDIQPVGTISAYAGMTASIPSGWSICDGGFLSISTYSDLHTALNEGKIYGYTQSGTLTRVSGSNLGDLTGKKFFYTTSGQNIECTILSATATTDVAYTVEIFVDPLYHSGSLAGQYHNISQLPNINGLSLTDPDFSATTFNLNAGSKVNFKKPDLRSRFLLGSSRSMNGSQPTAFAGYTLGFAGGEEMHTLSVSSMPSHNHTFSLNTSLDPGHRHFTVLNTVVSNYELNGFVGTGDSVVQAGLFTTDFSAYRLTGRTPGEPNVSPSSTGGSHSHTISGTINSAGVNAPHNNVPQHVVVYWIIKTRKDSVAKIFRLGPSGGGAVIAKNTPKRWARMTTPGAGCTVDISYGDWTVSRLGTGDYRFSHNMTAELGTGADQTKYIVEATVVGNTATNMLLANPYSLEGNTMGVRIWDVRGATFSDSFQHLCLVVYGGGTAL